MLKLYKVLVVNDEAIQVKMIESLLTSVCKIDKSRVQTATNGQEAYKAAIATSFDIIIMDLHMHTMNGIESCKKIKQFYITEDFSNKLNFDYKGKSSLVQEEQHLIHN